MPPLRLAKWTPEADPAIGGMLAGFDGSGTVAARLTGTAVDPQEFFAISAARRAPLAGSLRHVGEQKFLRRGDQARELLRRERSDFAEGIESAYKGDFGFQHVAKSRKRALIEQGQAELQIGARGEVRDGKGRVESGRERGGAEAVEAFAADPFIERVLGSELRQEFITYKSEEWRTYHQQVSAWEIQQYARLF